MDRVETRELAYFVAVAEELHFGRAAERLGIAQPPLSRAIKQLERRLGVTLLERSSRRVALTAAGEVLLHEGAKALDAVATATRRAQRANGSGAVLVLVVKPGGDGGLLTDILAEYETRPDAAAVDVVTCSAAEQATFLRDGRADVGLMHRPHADLSRLDSEDLLTEEQVAMLPARHRLAARPLLRLADLQGETMPRRLGREDDTAPVVHSLGELQQLVALGRMVALVPASLRDQVRHDLVGIPVIDAPTTSLVIAWPPGGHSAPRAAFVHAATTVAHRARRRSSRPHSLARLGLGEEGTCAGND